MKLIATLITACLALAFSKSDNTVVSVNDCKANLIVEKNRSSKSADEEGTQFTLVLTNTSRSLKTYNLSTKNLSEPCNTKTQYNRGTSSMNAKLDVTFQDSNSNRGNSNTSPNKRIELQSGESYKFIVSVKVPNNTPYNTWSCIEVDAKSTECESISETQTLSVYVVDPSEG